MGLQDYEAKTLPSWKMPDESLFYLHRISHMTSRDNHVTKHATPTLSEWVSTDGLAAEVAGHWGLSRRFEQRISSFSLPIKHRSREGGDIIQP